jgi:anti-sigma factor RsiW
MSPCERIEGLLASYVDGELAPEEKALVEAHLAACPECAALAACLKSADAAFAAFPEFEPAPALMIKLRAVPTAAGAPGFVRGSTSAAKARPLALRRRFRFSFDVLLRPSLQPVFAVITILAVGFSLYMASPDKKRIDQAINRQIHLGYSAFEKLTARAGALTDSLGAAADNLFVSLGHMNPLGKTDR